MPATEPRFPIVGVGASAGGVEALQGLFRAMPVPLDMAFVVVTHLGAGHESALPDILRDCTSMPVSAARNGQTVESGHAYVLPHDAVITIAGGKLALRTQEPQAPRERQPIDVFFASLAEDQGECAVGIVLSGSGADGTLGLKAIKQRGGLTIAQGVDGTAPRYPEMPSSAVAGGTVDLILSVEEIPARLNELAHDSGAIVTDFEDGQRPEYRAAQTAISAILQTRIGHDFSGYKDGTFFRRVQRRIQLLRMPSIDAYTEFLRTDPDEAGNLFRDLLIGVTGFFRDPEAFDMLAERVIPSLFEGRASKDTVRVWVPGCATGEEAYSLAILLGERRDATPGAPRVQVFATDIDEAALSIARAGRYPAALTTTIGAERLARWFLPDGSAYVVKKELRDVCVFSPHSVIRDAPFSRLDLISCRNLLIYLGGALQEHVLPLFHYALRPDGFLFLGVSETMARHAELFVAEDRGYRIFRRRAHPTPMILQPRVAPMPPGSLRARPAVTLGRPGQRGGELRQLAESFIMEQVAPAHVIVNGDGDVIYQSAALGRYLEPAAGVPSRQLLLLARRGLRPELRSALREATESQRRVVRPLVEIELDDRVQAITLTVAPLPSRGNPDPLFVVLFADLGPPQPRTAADVQGDTPANAATALLERDLRDLRERLQSVGEEYETTTEELKSANEEMVSVNEELQSTNEELETSKEELQSVNEELRTANVDLAHKVDELDRSNADLQNLFDSTQIATVFLDRSLVIRSFTPAVTSIFNLVASDRGRPLTDFASQLDRVDLRAETSRVLEERKTAERRVTARDGVAHYLMRMLPYRAGDGSIDGVVVTFFDVTQVVEGEVLGTLVNELNHRVRNMLQVVQAVANSSLRRATSLEEFRSSFGGRLRALGRAQELVSLGKSDEAPLADLVQRELQPYVDDQARVTAAGPPVRLPTKLTLALGMVLHEWATNATKHGALSVDVGRVAVTWSVDGAPPDAKLVLHWVESGGPAVASPSRRGFGSELIGRLVRGDCGGTVETDFAIAGLRATLTIPIGEVRPRLVDAPTTRRVAPTADGVAAA